MRARPTFYCGGCLMALSKNLEALHAKAFALQEAKDWNACILVCREFLKLAEKEMAAPATTKASMHVVLGTAYLHQGDIDLAGTHYNKAVELDPQDSIAYLYRADYHVIKGDFGKALEDFRSAVEHQSASMLAWTRSDPACYIASKVQFAGTFEYLFKIAWSVNKIKSELIYRPSRSRKPVFHYTELKTLKKLVEGEQFRLYNADYMDDPQEGEIFWDIIDGHDIREDIYRESIYRDSEEWLFLSPTYIGSFVRMKDEKKRSGKDYREAEKYDPEDGELFLWRTYGKNAGVEAAGACLHFDISLFAKKPDLRFGQMSSPLAECMYKVVYENEIRSRKYKKLRDHLGELAEKLADTPRVEWTEREVAFRMTKELLDEIRFLFKVDQYQNERELRIVRSRYTSTPVPPGESAAESENEESDVKADDDHQPPRLYLETMFLDLQAVTARPQDAKLSGLDALA